MVPGVGGDGGDVVDDDVVLFRLKRCFFSYQCL